MADMISKIAEMFSYSFILRAFLVGILVSLCAALLGVNLVLKRYSMIGDGLSHVGFGALAIAAALGFAPMIIALPVIIIAAFLLLRLSESSKIKGDAAIALVSGSALAIGAMATSLGKGGNTDLNGYMFGSILAVSKSDAYIGILACVAVIILYIVLYNRMFAVTFDENFSKATGMRTGTMNTILAVLTAVTVVIGLRMMGALLISSLIIFPCLSAMRFTRTYKSTVITSGIISVLCFCAGMITSYMLEVPTGACIVIVELAVFLISVLVGKIAGGAKKANR